MGVHHGIEGFREVSLSHFSTAATPADPLSQFSNARGIVRRGTAPDMLAAFYPPYSVSSALSQRLVLAANFCLRSPHLASPISRGPRLVLLPSEATFDEETNTFLSFVTGQMSIPYRALKI